MLNTVVGFVIFLALLMTTKLIMGALIAVYDSLLETREERKREIFLSPRVSRVTSEICCAANDQAVQIILKRERSVSGKSYMFTVPRQNINTIW